MTYLLLFSSITNEASNYRPLMHQLTGTDDAGQPTLCFLANIHQEFLAY